MRRYQQGAIGHPGRTLLIWLAVMMLGGAATGYPIESSTGGVDMIEDIVIFGAASLVVLLTLMWLVFRCWQGVLATLLVVMSSISVSYGAMSLAGVAVTMPLSAVMVFLTALGMQYATYVGFAYRERTYRERRHARPVPKDHRFILSEAMGDVRGAVFLGAVVTAIGFGSLFINRIPDLKLMGIVLAIGLVTTSLGVMTIIPAMFAKFPFEVPPQNRHHFRLQQVIDRAGLLSTSRPWLMLTISAIIFGLGVFGVTRLDPNTDAMKSSMLLSLGIATLLIWLVMCIGFGSLKLGTLSLIPNLAPLILVYAFLPLIGQPLDPPTAVTGAIALGILSNDTVHFIKTWIAHRRKGSTDASSAVLATLSEVGKPMILSSFVVMIGFSIMLLSRYDTLVWTGIMMIIVTSTAVLWRLVCSPALLRLAGKRPLEQTPEGLTPLRDFQKFTVKEGDKRTKLAEFSDKEIQNMYIGDLLALSGKSVMRQGGVHGTRRLLVELDLHPGQRVLEVGTGVGASTFSLAALDPTLRLTSIDLSVFMLEQARKRAEELGLGDRIEFVQGHDPNVLPFDDGTFDAVFIEGVAMYNEPEAFFRELFRVLKPGGRVGLHDWVWAQQPSEDVVVQTCFVACGCNVSDMTFYTQAEWEQHLTRQGFEIHFAEEYPFSFFSVSGMMDDEGTWGALKMFGRILGRRALMRRMLNIMTLFTRHESKYGYTITVARKPAAAAVAPEPSLDGAAPGGAAEPGEASQA